MNKGEKYDQMTQKPKDDPLGLFENYHENMFYVQEYIRTKNFKVIYDIGCGTGSLTGPLAKDFNVIGIDQSDEMLSQAKRKYPQMAFVNKRLEEWIEVKELKNDNLFISSFVLHSIKDKVPLMEFFSKMVKNKNTVMIMDYIFNNQSEELAFIKKLEKEKKNDLARFIERKHYLKIKDLRAWCQELDFKLKVKMLNHWIGLIEIS